MAFCEDCGSKLTPGMAFCENCGAKITEILQDDLSSKEIAETGIIYTNLLLLEKKSRTSKEKLCSIIDSFILSTIKRNVSYELFDVSKEISNLGTVENHLKIISNIVKEKHPKYLFILGSSDVIPSTVWENEACDYESDSDVSSDLPFATLDIDSPFSGKEYNFEEALRVGRLPTIDFENYFANLEAACGKIEEINTFALSAAVWADETVDIYSNIKSGPKVSTSPEVEKSIIKETIPSDSNMFLFNLHGSDKTKYWYGQEDSSFPEAIEPTSFSKIEKPYFLVVEACYGAAYEGRNISESVLLSTLSEKCISFLGSSRIAFGRPCAPGSCADVICGEFLKNVKAKMSAGDALNKAREVLMEDGDNSEVIKTLAEFSLYGDPSARMQGMPTKEKGLFAKNNSKSFSKGIHIPLPNVRRAVHLELTSVEQKIADLVEEFVYQHYLDMNGIKPKYYKQQNKDVMTAVFENQTQIGKKIVSVNFEKNGKIKQMLESK